VLSPRQPHRLAADGQVDIAHRRPLFDLPGAPASLADSLDDGLLAHQLDIGTDAPVGKDTNVLVACSP